MFRRRGKLGEGTYGVVYHATSPRGTDYAVKRNLTGVETGGFMGCVREIDILSAVKGHECVVDTRYVHMGTSFSGSCLSPIQGKKEREGQQDDIFQFVFEKADYDLHTYIYQPRLPDYRQLRKYMLQMALGLEHIHNQGLIHRDIKPNNVLIFKEALDSSGEKGIAKVCDFGLAKPHTYQGSQTPDVVTSWYRAPEIALGNPKYDGKVDIWSMGCVFFEMIARRALFLDMPDNNDVVLSRILGKLPNPLTSEEYNQLISRNPYRTIRLTQAVNCRQRQSFPEQLWPAGATRPKYKAAFEEQLGPGSLDLFCDLLGKMLAFDFGKRLNVQQVIDHPFFRAHQTLIQNIRSKCPKAPGTRMVVTKCIEREWGMRLARDIYARRETFTSWYTDRILFQGMDLYDRYISTITKTTLPHPTVVESEHRGRYHTRFECELRFIVCMYIAIKYFASIQSPVPYTVIADESFKTQAAIHQAQHFELNFIQNCLQYRVYRPTLYEEADKLGIILTQPQIEMLVNLYSLGDDLDGVTPLQFLEKYLKKDPEPVVVGTLQPNRTTTPKPPVPRQGLVMPSLPTPIHAPYLRVGTYA